MARALVRTGCPAEGKAAPGRQDPATHRSPRGRLGLTPPRIGEEPKKAGRSPLFRIARRCRDGLPGRCPLPFFAGLHRQAARKRVLLGTSVSVRVDLGGRRIIKKKTTSFNK